MKTSFNLTFRPVGLAVDWEFTPFTDGVCITRTERNGPDNIISQRLLPTAAARKVWLKVRSAIKAKARCKPVATKVAVLRHQYPVNTNKGWSAENEQLNTVYFCARGQQVSVVMEYDAFAARTRDWVEAGAGDDYRFRDRFTTTREKALRYHKKLIETRGFATLN